MAQELGDLDELGELQRIEAELVQTLAEEDVEHLAAAMDPGSVAGVLVYENTWAAPVRFGACAAPAASSSPTAASRSRPSSPPSRPTRRSKEEPEMPLGPGRAGRGVIGGPVAKVAVVGAVAAQAAPQSPRRRSSAQR